MANQVLITHAPIFEAKTTNNINAAIEPHDDHLFEGINSDLMAASDIVFKYPTFKAFHDGWGFEDASPRSILKDFTKAESQLLASLALLKAAKAKINLELN